MTSGSAGLAVRALLEKASPWSVFAAATRSTPIGRGFPVSPGDHDIFAFQAYCICRSFSACDSTFAGDYSSPTRLIGAGTEAGTVIQAVRHLGPGGLEPKQRDRLRRSLKAKTKRELKKLSPELPQWIQPIVNEIIVESEMP